MGGKYLKGREKEIDARQKGRLEKVEVGTEQREVQINGLGAVRVCDQPIRREPERANSNRSTTPPQHAII